MATGALMDRHFWTSAETQLLINPRTPQAERELLEGAIQKYHHLQLLWLRSSGTESARHGIKLVGIHRDSFKVAAQAANDFLGLSVNDRWLNPLPVFHVGGLSVSLRCLLAGAQEYRQEQWDAQDYFHSLQVNHISVSSLVPTQVFDLLQLQKPAPETLRWILVGGGALTQNLFNEAKALGYHLIPSYGMTETCALMAANREPQKNWPWLEPLPHWSWVQNEGRWSVSGPALFKGYLWVTKEGEHWQEQITAFTLDDHIVKHEHQLKILGRESELLKILGETVNLSELKNRIQNQLGCPVEITSASDERRGYNLHLWLECEVSPLELDDLNSLVMPYERFLTMTCLQKFPRSELGKVIKSQLTVLT